MCGRIAIRTLAVSCIVSRPFADLEGWQALLRALYRDVPFSLGRLATLVEK